MRYSFTEQEKAAAKAVAQQVMTVRKDDLPTKTLPADRWNKSPRTVIDFSGENAKLAQILCAILGIEIDIAAGKVVGHDDVKVEVERHFDRGGVTLRSARGDILALGWEFATPHREAYMSYLSHEIAPGVQEDGWGGDCFPTQRWK